MVFGKRCDERFSNEEPEFETGIGYRENDKTDVEPRSRIIRNCSGPGNSRSSMLIRGANFFIALSSFGIT
jgi:hypothetical protein